MEMKLNSLPSKTWNFLKINDSILKIEENTASYVPEVKNENKYASCLTLNGEIPDIYKMKTGMGDDMTSFTEQAEILEIVSSENSTSDLPVFLRYSYKNGDNCKSRLLIHGKKNSVLKVVIQLDSEEESHGISALQTRIYAEEGSKVELYTANLLGKSFIYLNDIGGVTEKDAKIKVLKLELGGKSLYAGTEIGLLGNGSSFSCDVGYHTKAYQSLDMNYNSVHFGKKTETEIQVTGSLENEAEKIFRGTIDFRKGSSGAVGTERENVLMFGEDTVNKSIPLILCEEEDVEGNHGASIGRLDEKVLFYLSSRGFSEDASRKMISASRINSICSQIPLENVKNAVEEFEKEQQ